jgi:DNA-binding NtrC family response regulator
MLVEALQANGHRVSTVENNVELFAAVKRAGTRCILILDQASVFGSLSEVLQGIQSKTKSMPPVILLTGVGAKEIDTDFVVHRLQKPFVLEALLGEIAKISSPHS